MRRSGRHRPCSRVMKRKGVPTEIGQSVWGSICRMPVDRLRSLQFEVPSSAAFSSIPIPSYSGCEIVTNCSERLGRIAAACVGWLSEHGTWPLAAPFVVLCIASPAVARWASRSPLVAGRLSVSVTANLGAGVSFGGNVALMINRTGPAVDRSLTVGGSAVEFSLLAGPYLRVAVTPVAGATSAYLDIAGQRFEASSFELEQSTVAGADGALGTPDDGRVLHIAASGVGLSLGGGLVTVSAGELDLEVTEAGLAGSVTATVSIGGTGTVTGSKYLLHHAGRRLLLDCGLFQGLKQLRLRNWDPLPVRPADIDAVLLTHAHIDHSGMLPALYRDGFKGPVWTTAATADLAEILMQDTAHLQEEEARYRNRHAATKHTPAKPLYTVRDAQKAIQHLKRVEAHAVVALEGGVKVRFTPAGHILGASSIAIEHKGKSVLFSGDLGRDDDLVMLPPAQFVDRCEHLGPPHLVNFETLPDAAQQGDRQLAAEMFAEFLEAVEHDQISVRVRIKHLRREQVEAQRLDQLQNPLRRRGREAADVARVDRIERDADRHRLAVTQLVFGKLLELVRRPVPEIERTRRAKLKRIARGRDVVHVQLGTAIDQPLHCRRFEIPQRHRVAFERLEKFPVADARHLHRLDDGADRLGQGFGVALGVKLANRDKFVALFIGDGSFLYNPVLQGLESTNRHTKLLAGLQVLLGLLNQRSHATLRIGTPSHQTDRLTLANRLVPIGA